MRNVTSIQNIDGRHFLSTAAPVGTHNRITATTTINLHEKIYKSHNNQLIQILFASGLALNVDSVMEGRGNTSIMVGYL